MAEKGVVLFGKTVAVTMRSKELMGGLVLPDSMLNPQTGKPPSSFTEFVVAAIGPEVANVSVGDVVLCGIPSMHQMSVFDPTGAGKEKACFLVDESQIKGRVAR